MATFLSHRASSSVFQLPFLPSILSLWLLRESASSFQPVINITINQLYIIKKSHQIPTPMTNHHILTHVFSWQWSFYSASLSIISRVIQAAFQNLGFSHFPDNFLAQGFKKTHTTQVCILSLPFAAYYSTLWKKWNRSSTWHLLSICIPTNN